MRLAAAETEIEKYLSLGNYYVAYFRILNTLGIENLHGCRCCISHIRITLMTV